MSDYTGQCLCGAIHFIAQGEPKWIAFCHCQSCRRATGAVAALYAGFDERQVRFDRQSPASFSSSPGVKRDFCPTCGTPLAYRSERWPGEIHFFVGLFDQAEKMRPQAHVYTREQLPWLHIADDLPRYATFEGKETSEE